MSGRAVAWQGALMLAVLGGTALADDGRRYVNPPGLYDASRYYTHVIDVPAGSRTVYVAGQVGVDATGAIVAPDMAGQIARAFANLQTALEGGGARPEDVVKIAAFFVGYRREHLGPFTEELHALFPPGRLPTSTVLGVERLARDGLLFEIEAVAEVP